MNLSLLPSPGLLEVLCTTSATAAAEELNRENFFQTPLSTGGHQAAKLTAAPGGSVPVPALGKEPVGVAECLVLPQDNSSARKSRLFLTHQSSWHSQGTSLCQVAQGQRSNVSSKTASHKSQAKGMLQPAVLGCSALTHLMVLLENSLLFPMSGALPVLAGAVEVVQPPSELS